MTVHQPRLPMALGDSRQFTPVAHIAEGAARYAADRGLTYDPSGLEHVKVDPVRGFAQYQAYRQAETQPPAPSTLRSYDAMIKETEAQYDHMTKPAHQGGMGISVEVTDTNPYDTPNALADDLRASRIKVLSTRSTGGHSLMTDEQNDKFRAVHDVFGHAGIGRGFSRDGEEAAYRSHAQMFTPQAREALASETRGQNSYLNFRPEGPDFPGNAVVGMPKWAQGTGKFNGAPEALAEIRATKRRRASQASEAQGRFDI